MAMREHEDTHAHAHAHGPLPPGLRDRSLAVDRATRRLALLVALPLAIVTLLGLILLRPTETVDVPPEIGPAADTSKATVERVRIDTCPPEQGGDTDTCQLVTMRLQDGPEKGGRAEMALGIRSNPGLPFFDEGDRIVVQRVFFGNEPSYIFADFQRERPLFLLALGFAVLVVVLARWRGVAALAGLAVTLAVLALFILPSILQGRNPVAVCVVGAAAVMFAVFFLTFGVNLRSVAALTGTVVSLAITGILATWVVSASHLTGGGSEESLTVKALAGQVNLRGLLLGGVIIGALGVLNDVTITQASAVWQLRLASPDLAPRALYTRAMQVGRDHIGATVDTLVLAYAGASLPLLIFFTLTANPVRSVLTSSIVAEEIVRSLVGAVGLVASVPITTAIAAFLAGRAQIPEDEPEVEPEEGVHS